MPGQSVWAVLLALPSLAAATTGACPAGDKAKVIVTQDLISLGCGEDLFYSLYVHMVYEE